MTIAIAYSSFLPGLATGGVVFGLYGMAFIGGLLEMATGRKIEASTPGGRLLHVDPASGEVTLKFKLPGFGSSTPAH